MSEVLSERKSANTNESLQAQIFQRLHPRAYLERFVAENFRPDGRGLSDFRDISINVGSISTADGSALVRLGETIVVCGVKAEIAAPELHRPREGFLVPNLDLPAMCSPKFKPGPPIEEAQVLSDRLNEALIATGLLSLSSLCIESDKAAWVLYVDATCLNYDGNVFDAALLSMVAALKNTKLPKAIFDESSGRTICILEQKTALKIEKIPISMSFGIFDSTHIFADPTAFEEPLLDTSFTIVLDGNDQIITVSQLGSEIAETQDSLLECISISKRRSASLKKLLS